MPPRQPHPVRPSAARGTRCLAKVGPRAASATSERGSETRRLLQRNWGRAAEVSVASFLRWGALPRDARFSALVPHARWRNLLASKRRQQLRPLGRNLHRALHSRTPLEGWNSQENQMVTINRKALKSPRGDQAEHHSSARRSSDGTIPLRPSRDRGYVRHPSRSRRAPTAPLKLSCLKPYTSGVSSALDARAWRNGRRSGLEGNLSARWETGDAELPKFGEPCHMAIPSQARPEPSSREGVETRRAAPNPGSAGHGEGIVQTANPASAPGRRKP